MGTGSFPGVKSGRGVMLTPHPLLVPLVMKEWSYTSTPPVGRTACTEPQCLYKGVLYLYLFFTLSGTTRHDTTRRDIILVHICYVSVVICRWPPSVDSSISKPSKNILSCRAVSCRVVKCESIFTPKTNFCKIWSCLTAVFCQYLNSSVTSLPKDTVWLPTRLASATHFGPFA